MEPSRIVDAKELPWRESPHAGVFWKKLYFDRSSGQSTVLLKFEPGAKYGAHRHPKGEEYFVLEGSLEDLGKTYGAGTFVRHPAGSVHRPSSKEGCQLLVSLNQPIEEVGDP